MTEHISIARRPVARRLLGWAPMIVAAAAIAVVAALVLKPASHGSGLVGSKAPGFTLRDTRGAALSLSSLVGHPVLLNFWGVSCAPCRREMPVLQQAFERYRAAGLLVVGVDAQVDDAQAVEAFAAEHGATYPMLLNPSQSLMQAYTLDALPRSFFIDRSGVIRLDGRTPFEDAATLDQALKTIL
jgi:cytochrome c biogenesis protein CcmG/thiol:disulfide interchange protein DsbE